MSTEQNVSSIPHESGTGVTASGESSDKEGPGATRPACKPHIVRNEAALIVRARLDDLMSAASRPGAISYETAEEWEQELLAAVDGLVEQLEAAKAWYRDHVNKEGWYDGSMWGDPFAISPQLRQALTSNPASVSGAGGASGSADLGAHTENQPAPETPAQSPASRDDA